MLRKCLIGLVLGAFVYPAGAYYVGWEGDCLPEEAGWTRHWGDWSGPHHGTGAVRTIADGVMTIDALYDAGVFDGAIMHRAFNPAPGELFVMEWRLAVDKVTPVTAAYDPGVTLFSDDGWAVAFRYDGQTVFNPVEPGWFAPVSGAQFHDYRMTSWNMRTYELFVDGELVHEGSFWYCAGSPEMSWGDNVQGAASLHRWDYVRVFTIPEPSCLALCGAFLVVLARMRRSSWELQERRERW